MPEPRGEMFPKKEEVRLEDIPRYQSSFSRDNIKKISSLEKERVTILFPDEFYNATIEMCKASNETRGVLLVSSENNESFAQGKLLVQSIMTLGVGTSTSVFPDEKKISAMNKLLRDNKDVLYIDFHSHTLKTGEHWADKFSGGDNQSLANNVNRKSGYMHVLFTPKNILTFGKGKPQFGVAKIKKFNPIESQAYWQNKFNEYLSRE